MTARFFKTASEINLYYCWIVYLINLLSAEDYLVNPIPCVLVLVGALLINMSDALKDRNKVIHIIAVGVAVVFPALSFVLGFNKYSILEYIIPWFYYCFVFFGQRQTTDRVDYEHRFKIMCISLSPILMLVITFDEFKGLTALFSIFPWILMLIASGLLTLQNLRWKGNSHGKASYEKRQLLELLAFGVLAVFVAVTDYIQRLNDIFLEKVLFPFIKMVFGGSIAGAYGFIMLVRKITYKPNRLLREKEFVEYVEQTHHTNGNPPPAPEQVQTVVEEVTRKSSEELIIIIIVAVIVVAIMISQKRKRRVVVSARETREKIEIPKVKKVKKTRTEADTVRTLYARHMRNINQAASGKGKIGKADTTQDIKAKAAHIGAFSEEDESYITDVYRRARYKDEIGTNSVKKLRKLIK